MKNRISIMFVCLLSVNLWGCAAIDSQSATSNPDVQQTQTQGTSAQSTATSSNEKSAKNDKTQDTLLSFSGDAPSTQWFFNDVKIQDYA